MIRRSPRRPCTLGARRRRARVCEGHAPRGPGALRRVDAERRLESVVRRMAGQQFFAWSARWSRGSFSCRAARTPLRSCRCKACADARVRNSSCRSSDLLTGSVWGTGIYTDDSSIAAAAVHAGLLKPREIGFVRVVVDDGRESYAASESNGVKSQPYGMWEGSFRLERVAK
ncbi:MAG TPA: LCCL domain-containing protein [Vicinamibacterales bacterium]|nr:LCCL domain-containing protein [Vicinamibacterales bacterium]